MSRLRSTLLLVRDLSATSAFLQSGLKLTPLATAPRQALFDAGTTELHVHEVEMGQEAPLSRGYSPFLNFEVQAFDETLYRLLEMGATMDGAVQHHPFGKTVVLRTPDGFMIGLEEDDAVTDQPA